ncbi:MAG: DUF424 family protein [Candidatus Heimdallarchaeota archaeon]|nr:DUF424 family protein [Candidatus Heimdallarchaeota archaeon]
MTKNQKFYLRARRTEKEYLVSVCDADLLGKTLCEGELELCVSERFFGGELVSLERCLEEMWKASSLNLIGTAIVTAAIKERMINELSVMWINCPENGRTGHAMLLR